jgi:hypothetical protein
MHGFWLLVHFLGFTLWLGGGIATMVAGVNAKNFAPVERLKAYKLIGAIQRLLVGPGAAGVVISGVMLLLTGSYMHAGAGAGMPGWLNVMMGAGVLGAIAAVTVSMPTAARMARLEPSARGELPEAFLGLRKRQAIAATIAGSLGLIAMFAATLGR